ncbi:corrinoid adenosyltransferase MMAB-like [Halichondria panicea]|uniref:corrinoid adenosyltransferase MMAB-like n=1 Tax=Halichondria panicea TaxID=6063 RepID=UPI00312BBA48
MLSLLHRTVCARSASSRRLLELSRRLSDDSAPTKLRVYTRTGDKGVTSTFSGQRLPKTDVIFEALGANDELSSYVGLAREYCLDLEETVDLTFGSPAAPLTEILQEIQSLLQDVGSHMATPRDKATPKKRALTDFSESHVTKLETLINAMDDHLPELKNFILPSGGKSSAHLHVARTICRRAERRVVPLYVSGQVDHTVAKYLNRLSDFLFTAARFTAHREGKNEVVYQKVK